MLFLIEVRCCTVILTKVYCKLAYLCIDLQWLLSTTWKLTTAKADENTNMSTGAKLAPS
jgi:hypothetical protein